MAVLPHVAGWIFLFATLPFVFVVFFPLRVWKWLVVAAARMFRKDLKSLLTAYDSIFAIDDFYGKSYAANVTFFVVDGHMDVETLRKGFTKNVLSKETVDGEKLYDRLFQRPTSFGGYFFWEEVQFDITKQIRVGHEFRSMDHTTELHTVLADLMTSPLPGALWEILLYKGFEYDKSVVVFRIHHVLGDGYSFNHLVDEMIQETSKYMVKQKPLDFDEKLKLAVTAPTRIASLYQEAFTHSDCFTKKKKSETGVLSCTTLPLDVMKAIRRKTKSHFATVGMSILGGAVRRYYLEQNKPMPPYVSIMHSLPKPGHPLTSMCNHWGVGLFKIPLDTPSALERLERAEVSFNQYMKDQFDQLIHSHIPLFSLLPNLFIKVFFMTNFGTGFGFTSVPAFENEAHLWGHRVRNMYKIFGLQWKQSALAAAVYTHNGTVAYSIFANKDIIEDQAGVDKMTREHLTAEFQQLASELGIDVAPWSPTRDNVSPASSPTTPTANGIPAVISNGRPVRAEGFA